MSLDAGLVWFRRDLRLHDHPALSDALARADHIAPLFVLDPALITGRWRSPNRTWFMLASLADLAASLEAAGSALAVRVGRPEEVVPAFAQEVGARAVHVSRDYAPYGRARDRRVAETLRRAGVPLHATRGNLIHEPEDLATRSGTPYRVFGPFHRTWSDITVRTSLAAPASIPTGSFAARGQPTAAAAISRVSAWLDALRRWLEALPPAPTILCGDFNAPRGREIFTAFTQRFTDNLPGASALHLPLDALVDDCLRLVQPVAQARSILLQVIAEQHDIGVGPRQVGGAVGASAVHDEHLVAPDRGQKRIARGNGPAAQVRHLVDRQRLLAAAVAGQDAARFGHVPGPARQRRGHEAADQRSQPAQEQGQDGQQRAAGADDPGMTAHCEGAARPGRGQDPAGPAAL